MILDEHAENEHASCVRIHLHPTIHRLCESEEPATTTMNVGRDEAYAWPDLVDMIRIDLLRFHNGIRHQHG
eukprot:CAMPEP_0198115192 /NCGR_PEP_ID=MMETSP1442-20131203/6371_1 /TAXON_ID= /ORGANISM="Craspedostauros australis, Strain CCMP3328" /LENGTH=70 /DNA_ID=CAMNT_0043772653 /DNA_START=677 /DNA_END=885 /DNA_ORIENTATION=+